MKKIIGDINFEIERGCLFLKNLYYSIKPKYLNMYLNTYDYQDCSSPMNCMLSPHGLTMRAVLFTGGAERHPSFTSKPEVCLI